MKTTHSISITVKTLVVVAFTTLAIAPNTVRAMAERGRPHLNAARTTFVGDDGQPLRGPYTSTEWTGAVPAQNIGNLTNLGFNAVHLYAEDFNTNYPAAGSQAPGYSMANVDAIVAETATNGLYLIITIGNGANNGDYNLAFATNFWALYAPRYANDTHVLYEIQNEPVAWGPPYSSPSATPPGAMNLEEAAYNVIHANAPNTPVLLFSYSVFGGASGASSALTDIHDFNTAIFGNANEVWTNIAVAFHGYAGWQSATSAVSSLLASGFPCFMTEYYTTPWGTTLDTLDAQMTSELETMGVSWLTFQYVPPTGVSTDVTQPQYYQNIVSNAGLSWLPDYGTFPPARAPYGNGGQPWTIPASYVNSVLTGSPLVIPAVDFDSGGQGVAYSVTNTVNATVYRTNDLVDIEPTTDTGGGYDVTGTAAGEWLEYTIWVQQPGYYDLSLRYAAANDGSVVQVAGNGNSSGSWALPNTGGSTNWATTTQPVLLGTGRQVMRLNILNGGFSLNWLQVTPATNGLVANGIYKFLNAGSGLVLTGLPANNTVVATNYTGSTYQQWNLQYIGGGQYKITSVTNGWSWNENSGTLDVSSAWSASSAGECFILQPASGNFYAVLPVSSGLPLETSVASSTTIDQNAAFNGGAYQQWAIATPAAPSFPAGLSASAISATQNSLTWTAVAGASSYNVKVSANSGGPYTTIASGVTTTTYTNNVPIGMTYYYVVSSLSGGVESPNSAQVSVTLPYPWATQDIGAVGLPGSATFSGGIFTVSGCGTDIWGTADAFRFVYLPVTGNCTMIARVSSVQDIDPWSKAGIMIRSSLSANSANALIAVTPGNGVTWQYRTTTGGTSANTTFAGAAPYWVKLVRSGNTLTGYRSPDGVNWTLEGTETISMASTNYIGLAVTSHNASYLCSATFDNVTGPGWTTNPIAPAVPTGLAASVLNWNVDLSWTASSNAVSYNVKRSTTFGGPYVLLANVATTNFIDSQLANGVSYYYVVTGLNDGGESADSTQTSVPGQMFSPSGLTAMQASANQVNLSWNAFPNAATYNVKRATVSGGPYADVATGLAATSYADAVAPGMDYYYVVSAISDGAETANSSEATVGFAYPWQTLDVGAVGLPGNASFGNGVFTLDGAGADIQNTADGFRFVYLSATGDCAVIARVTALENIAPWSKAGVMIRETTNANAANAFMGMTSGNGATWQYRSSTGGNTIYNNTPGLNAPYWIQLVRTGNTFTGYRSPDGINWTQQGSAMFTIASNVCVGLALTSHSTTSLGEGTFDNVTAPNWPTSLAPAAPLALTALAGDGRVALTWAASSRALDYNVERATASGGPYAIVSNVTTTNFTDNGLSDGTTYYYVVSALDLAGASANSVPASATPLPPLSLAFSLSVTNLTINWPQGYLGYTLESATDLSSGNWTLITSPQPQMIGNQWQISLPPPTNATTFYRLIK